MDLDGQRRSENIEDRRGKGGGLPGLGGGGGRGFRLPMGRGSLGIIAVVAVIYLLMGGSLSGLVSMFAGGGLALPGAEQAAPAGTQGLNQSASRSATEAETADRIAAVLGSTEDVWTAIFAESGETYQPATLVLFSGQTRSPCGSATAATGPFYCPADKKIYLDMAFFDDMATKMRAGGDFAQAYVVAHEVAHHVQGELGILGQANQQRSRAREAVANAISVRIELQADCFAGVWAARAQRARPILEPGDIEEGIAAAQAVGDDRLQRQAQGYVVPDSFTHGTSAQRVAWFKRGLESGDFATCDTFSARTL